MRTIDSPFKILLITGLTAVVLYSLTAASFRQNHQDNSPPQVTIVTPSKNSKFQWNSIIPYTIHVLDKEDGNSEYNEIPTHEVLLTVNYLPDSSQLKKFLTDRSKASHEPLVWMSTSTCFNCHASKTTIIGPSWEQIARRYPDLSTAIEPLAKKIITGGTGVWGNPKMPPHPDLKIEKARELVSWILKNTKDVDQNYLAGVEGAFRTKEKPDKGPGKGVYVLTASYMDHGLNGVPQSRLEVQHTIVLKNN